MNSKFCFSKRKFYLLLIFLLFLGVLFFSKKTQQNTLYSFKSNAQETECILDYSTNTFKGNCCPTNNGSSCRAGSLQISYSLDCSNNTFKRCLNLLGGCDRATGLCKNNLASLTLTPTITPTPKKSIGVMMNKPSIIPTISAIPDRVIPLPISNISGYKNGDGQNVKNIENLYVEVLLDDAENRKLNSMNLYHFNIRKSSIGEPLLHFVWIGKSANPIDFSVFSNKIWKLFLNTSNWTNQSYKAKIELILDPQKDANLSAFLNNKITYQNQVTYKYKRAEYTYKELFAQTRFYKITLYDGSASVTLVAFLGNDLSTSLKNDKELYHSLLGVNTNIDLLMFYKRDLINDERFLNSELIGFPSNSESCYYKYVCYQQIARELIGDDYESKIDGPGLDIYHLEYKFSYDTYFIKNESISPMISNVAYKMQDFINKNSSCLTGCK